MDRAHCFGMCYAGGAVGRVEHLPLETVRKHGCAGNAGILPAPVADGRLEGSVPGTAC